MDSEMAGRVAGIPASGVAAPRRHLPGSGFWAVAFAFLVAMTSALLIELYVGSVPVIRAGIALDLGASAPNKRSNEMSFNFTAVRTLEAAS